MKVTQSYNPVKIRHIDEAGRLDLGAGLHEYGDPVFADADAARVFLYAEREVRREEGGTDEWRGERFVIVPSHTV